MLLTTTCEVIVHTCFHACEWSELAGEGNEDKCKEEGSENKDIFALHQHSAFHSSISAGLTQRQRIQFNVNSLIGPVHISLPELPPELR
jgi:hypothetical protein